jgi:hypothetical protein
MLEREERTSPVKVRRGAPHSFLQEEGNYWLQNEQAIVQTNSAIDPDPSLKN